MGINSWHGIGNLGADPKIQTFGNGDKQASFLIGVGEKWKDKQSGERKERTDWVNIVCNRGLADVAEKYLHKGSKVFIEGKLRVRSYEKDGTIKYVTEIIANSLELLTPKQGGEQADNSKGAFLADLDDDVPF